MTVTTVALAIAFPVAYASKPSGWTPREGLLSSVRPSFDRPKYVFAMDIDYPPYAYIEEHSLDSPDSLNVIKGVGADMVNAMSRHCNFDVTIIQADWNECWQAGKIGDGLRQGLYHGCMTFTHPIGMRNRYVEFSKSWAIKNKPSGLLVRLNQSTGGPVISPYDNLEDKTIIDVTGWAPTPDTLQFSTNPCTNERFRGFRVVQSADMLSNQKDIKSQNDRALMALLAGHGDGVWVYGDQAHHYACATNLTSDAWDCDLWRGFGTEFAYVQTGLYDWLVDGTTVAMSKKGSGVASAMDACLDSFMHTKEYYEVCSKSHHNETQVNVCVPNQYFPQPSPGYQTPRWMLRTSEQTSDCASGYCRCDS